MSDLKTEWKIVVVEDSPTQLAYLGSVLGAEPDLQVVGLFPSAEKALDSVDWGPIDVLLTDLELPGLSGIGLIERLAFQHSRLIPLAYTVHDEPETVLAALAAGALGYVLKDSNPDHLIGAVRDATRGHSPISPGIARHLIEALRPGTDRPAAVELTRRQETVLHLLAAGKSHKEIAAELGISRHTVQVHVRDTYKKLHAVNRQDAVRRARVTGLLDPRN